MAFSDEIIVLAWKRSGGICECTRNYHEHGSEHSCGEKLIWEKRNCPGEKGAWFAHHKVAKTIGGREDDSDNCEILCHECHKSAASYGLF